MARATKEEALATRHRILDAAEAVFEKQGVSRTSLADIAEEARVTRGAVYWHFKNKADVFNAMCERVRLPMEEMADIDASMDPGDPLGSMRAATTFALRQTTGNPHSKAVFGILFNKCEFVDPEDPVYARQQEAVRAGRKRLEILIARAVRAGQLPDDIDIPLAAGVYQSFVTGLMKQWLFAPDSLDLEPEIERVVDVGIGMLQHAPALRRQ